MTTLEQRITEYNRRRAEIDRLVDAGQHTEPCFTCKAPATHRSRDITPAGHHAYQCAAHAKNVTTLWGSDPGWATIYEPISR
jgi:hypothetical protein